jgi:1-phosphofructokinase
MTNPRFQVITVTLNPAIDQIITISEFRPGAVNRVEKVRENPGGKGVNVASALVDYGIGVAATGFLGSKNSSIFEDLFERKNIGDHFVRIAGQTRVCIKINDPVHSETTDINFPGVTPQLNEMTAFYKQLDEVAAGGSLWIVLSGSVPPGMDPGIYCELIERFRARGHKVVLDTSGEPLRLALEAAPTIMKPNIHELEDLLGRPLKTRELIVEAAEHFIARGTALVIVSMGAEGALFVTADEVIFARPPSIPVSNSTVGAGDAMVAGMIVGHLRELPLADCARLATAFSIELLTRGKACLSSPAALEVAMEEVTLL